MKVRRLNVCLVGFLEAVLIWLCEPTLLPAQTIGTFGNPIISDGADPWIIFKDGNYYYTQTTGGEVTVRKSATISGLGFAPSVTVFTPSPPNNKNVWAPELHFLNGKWYIYFAADNGNNANHRMYAAEANTSDPQGTYAFKGKIYDQSNDRWAIDGTVLQLDDGSLYFLWSGWPGTSNVRQNIYIAPMSDPWTISGPRVLLSTPALNWEIYPDSAAPLINEGPEALKRNGKIFIIYSANKAWEDYYCLGLLVNTNGDVLNTNAWTKYPDPVFSGLVDETGAVYSPGHCSFTKTVAQTEDWILYHAAKFSGAGFNRNVRAQAFCWNADDTPFFAHPIPTNLPVIFPVGEGPSTPISVNPNVTNGMMQLDVYTGISGTSLTDLTNHVKFPAHPDLTRYVGQFEPPAGLGENYGARLSGYLKPAVTGQYVFYLCSTHQGALYLSTDGSPANKHLIASEPEWNPARTWTGTDRRPGQENISEAISLEGGQSYYVEALMKKSGAGADNLGVAWRPPAGSVPANGSPPIPGAYLAIIFDSTLTVKPIIAQQPTNQVRYSGMDANFSVTAASSVPPLYQWQKEAGSNDWQNITGGYSSPFVIAGVATNNSRNYRAVIKNQAGLAASDAAALRVLEPPKLEPRDSNNVFTVSFQGEPGFAYTLQATTNLFDWVSIASTNNVSGPVRFVDSESGIFPQRLYRLSIAP